MKLINFRHVPKQDVLLALQSAGYEVSHGGIVHLCCITLNRTSPNEHRDGRWSGFSTERLDSPPARTEAPQHRPSPSPGAHSSHAWEPREPYKQAMAYTDSKPITAAKWHFMRRAYDGLPTKYCQVFLLFWKGSMPCATIGYRRFPLETETHSNFYGIRRSNPYSYGASLKVFVHLLKCTLLRFLWKKKQTESDV